MRKKNKQEPTQSGPLTRRDFLKGASVAVSSGLLAGQEATGAATPDSSGQIVGPGETGVTLRVNGQIKKLSLEPRVTLLDALRERLDITGAKRVCDRGTCGACTMLLDGKPVYGCTVLAIEAQGHEITTIEGLAPEGQLHPVSAAFVKYDAQQCGFCTPGFVMACKAFLDKHPNPKMDDIEKGLGGNLCRCGTYSGIRQAVLDAAQAMKA